jgi:hypothetical protein
VHRSRDAADVINDGGCIASIMLTGDGDGDGDGDDNAESVIGGESVGVVACVDTGTIHSESMIITLE